MIKQPQHPEFDFNASVEARNEAIEQVDANAEPEWKEAARLIIYSLARTMEPFTTDDVWWLLVNQGTIPPHEPRAMGGVMMGLARAGVIKRLDGYRKSVMVGCHHRPKQLWIGA